MPFNTLLLSSLIDGTSVTESGVTARVERQSGEQILFFALDTAAVRKDLKIVGEACDFLVFYSRTGQKHQHSKKVLCLLELKGKDVPHAIDQIVNTQKHLREALQASTCWSHVRNDIIWKAYICCNRHSPITASSPYIDKLKIFERFDITRKPDLGAFLRK